MPSNSKPQVKRGVKAGVRPAPSPVGKAIAGRSEKRKRNIRIILGVLLLANVMAAGMVLYPPGGTAEGLGQQLATLQTEVTRSRARLEETRVTAAAVQMGRTDGDAFIDTYFLGTGSVNSTLLTEVTAIAERAGITQRGENFEGVLIEGSEILGMRTITANFEGTYRQLLNFVREVDRSPRLLMLESLSATPQKDEDLLLVTVEILAFTQEQEGFLPVEEPREEVAAVGEKIDGAGEVAP